MKRFLFTALTALTLLYVPQAKAGGKLQMRPQYYLDQHRPGIDGGLSIYQHLVWRFYVNSWLGAGIKPVASGYAGWAVANAELETKVTDKCSVSAGGYLRYNPKIAEKDNSVGVKVAYKLW